MPGRPTDIYWAPRRNAAFSLTKYEDFRYVASVADTHANPDSWEDYAYSDVGACRGCLTYPRRQGASRRRLTRKSPL